METVGKNIITIKYDMLKMSPCGSESLHTYNKQDHTNPNQVLKQVQST